MNYKGHMCLVPLVAFLSRHHVTGVGFLQQMLGVLLVMSFTLLGTLNTGLFVLHLAVSEMDQGQSYNRGDSFSIIASCFLYLFIYFFPVLFFLTQHCTVVVLAMYMKMPVSNIHINFVLFSFCLCLLTLLLHYAVSLKTLM